MATQPEPAVLPLPPALDLPRIPSADLQCLSDDAYRALVRRDRLQAERIQTLRGIIESAGRRGD